MLTVRILALAALPLFSTAPAHPASSDWHHVQGGSVRIVTSGAPDADGLVRGALQIDLKPGWKTYWLDPGSSGVPPQLSLTMGGEIALVDIGFPAPQRFDDGYALWTGYDAPITLALTMHLPPEATGPARVDASAFLGVCETICIPVQAELTFDPYADANDPADTRLVEEAFATVPPAAEDGFAARAIGVGDDAILIEAVVPDGAEATDLFVAGGDGLIVGVPEAVGRNENGTLFKLPVLRRAKNAPDMQHLAYTLVTSAGATSGKLTIR